MGTIFITATGTDIGKTYVATQLIRHARAGGGAVDALKPVVTGFDPARPEASDPAHLLAALGRPTTPDEIARVSPWRFAAPLSPDLAAAREGRTLDFDALIEFSRKVVSALSGTLFIEGIGGIMVPLDARHTVLDWMSALNVPLVLVTGSYLGSISHTLTCLEVLRARGLTIRVIVVNETRASYVSLADTISSVSRFAGTVPIMALPRSESPTTLAKMDNIISILQ